MRDGLFDHERLDVYQAARQFKRQLRELLPLIPRGNADLVDQLRRAARSITSNIAEASGKWTARETRRTTSRSPGAPPCTAQPAQTKPEPERLAIVERGAGGGAACACARPPRLCTRVHVPMPRPLARAHAAVPAVTRRALRASSPRTPSSPARATRRHERRPRAHATLRPACAPRSRPPSRGRVAPPPPRPRTRSTPRPAFHLRSSQIHASSTPGPRTRANCTFVPSANASCAESRRPPQEIVALEGRHEHTQWRLLNETVVTSALAPSPSGSATRIRENCCSLVRHRAAEGIRATDDG